MKHFVNLNLTKKLQMHFVEELKVRILGINRQTYIDCVKGVHIWSFSGMYSVQMRKKMDQQNSENGHFSRSGYLQGL